MAIMGNACAHLLQCACAISFSKRLPSQRARQRVDVSEDTESRDVIMRGVQFEEEQLAGFQRAKRSRARRPKVYFRQGLLRSQMLEPSAISNCNHELDRHATIPRGAAHDAYSRLK